MDPKKPDCGPPSECGVCATKTFDRNHYFHDKRLTVRDFRAEQEYFQEKRFLINRMIHGQGVVCGLGVRIESRVRDRLSVTLSPGLALDGRGREILVCDEKKVCLDVPVDCEVEQDGPRRYILCLEYCEHGVEPVSTGEGECEGQGAEEYNRQRDSWKLRLRQREEVLGEACKPACPLCDPEARGQPCPVEESDTPVQEPPKEAEGTCSGKLPTVHDYLCRVRGECPRCGPCDCVVLGTVTLTPHQEPPVQEPDCEPQGGEQREPECEKPTRPPVRWCAELDPCTDRRLVYTNPLLFDLVQCYHGDLPRITGVSWSALHRRRDVSWEEFDAAMRGGLRVCFDRPMKAETLDEHTFRVELRIPERDGYWVIWGVPGSIDVERGGRAVRFTIDSGWADDELHLDHSELARGARVEIRLIGSLIHDEEGKALDGEALRFPTGNGVQGGDFVSYFTVRLTGESEGVDEAQTGRSKRKPKS